MTLKLTQYFLTVLLVLLSVACTTQPPTKATQGVSRVTPPREPGATWEVAPAPREKQSVLQAPPAFETPSDSRANPQLPLTSGVFHKPPALEPQVAFWRKVYGAWSRSQVAIHDDRYLNVVYEVIHLPGEITESYTPSQKELIRERLGYWQSRLRELEQQWAGGIPLNADHQRLVSVIGQSSEIRTAIRSASERVRAQRGLRERFKRGLEISGRYDRHFREIFRNMGLPEDLAYLPHVESSFQAHARSSAGAVGIWQFTRTAAQTFMTVNRVIDERLDPIASARGAARYLSHAHGKLGSWPLALTSYNHGITGMQRAKDSFGHDFMRIVKEYDHPQFGFASRNFYAEFLAAREVASQPERFFPEGIRYEKPLEWDRAELTRHVPVSAVSRHYGTDKWRLIAMNTARANPTKLHREPAGTTRRLPSGTVHRMAHEKRINRPTEREVGVRNAPRRIQVHR